MNTLAFIVARLKEPSTYTGLSVLLADLHINLTSAQSSAIISALVALGGVAAVFLPEGKK